VPDDYQELETKLRDLAQSLPTPRPGDWLAQHPEPGQTFAQYLHAVPVRRNDKLHTIYLCLVGDFNEDQQRIINLSKDYLSIFFDSPVKVKRRVGLAAIPAQAKRQHPIWGDQQILTGYILEKVLQPERPVDALACLALTATDLWPGEGWNFVFGQADLLARTGVWSLYRNGDATKDFKLCLRRTLSTASHETSHLLRMAHCTAFSCLMNGSNNPEEKDRRPLHLCPVCLRKVSWSLQVEPVPYLQKQKAFCDKHGFIAETDWYGRALAVLNAPK
jgi:archaemetzincin